MENVFDEIIAENYKSEEGNRYSSIRRTEGTKQENPNKPTPRHDIFKTVKVKDKERTLKATIEKEMALPPKVPSDTHKVPRLFFCRNFAGQKGVWHDTFKVLKWKNW